MPFTPTHVLAILPIAAVGRLSLPFSALVIGSMIPDLPLFLPFGPDYSSTHSLVGVFGACLPLGLSCFLLFQLLMKRPLFALLPLAIQGRCVTLSRVRIEPTPGALGRASMAVVLGAATHLLWDSFTHRGRWGTRLLTGLDETALALGGHPVPGYKVLQYGSTLVGLPCLALLLAAWLHRREPVALDGSATLPRSGKVVGYLVAIAVPATVTILVWCRDDLSRYDRLGRSITMSGLVLMILTLVYCLAFHGRNWRPSPPK